MLFKKTLIVAPARSSSPNIHPCGLVEVLRQLLLSVSHRAKESKFGTQCMKFSLLLLNGADDRSDSPDSMMPFIPSGPVSITSGSIRPIR